MSKRFSAVVLMVGVALLSFLLLAALASPLGGMTHFTGVGIQQPTEVGTATPALLVDNLGVSNIAEFRDGGTPVWTLKDGGSVESSGVLDLNGQKLDLDADADTSVTADTDDQIDWEIGGADVMVWKDWGAGVIAASTTRHLVEIMDSTNVMTAGTNSLAALNIDLGVGDSTGGTNNVYGILIDDIVGDAQNTETGISVGTGWDFGLDLNGTGIILGADGGVVLDESSDDVVGLTLGASTGYVSVLTGNFRVGNGTPTVTQAGEDAYIEGDLEVDGSVYVSQVNAAGGSANPFDYTGTLGIMDGSDDFTLLDLNITSADHTGSSNTIQAIDIAGIVGDAHATETAIKIGSGWDVAIDADGAVNIDGATTVGVDGTSYDVTFYSDTEGDYLLWDQSEEKLVITGTDAATALEVADGNVVINDSLTVTAGALDVTVGATTLEALSVGVAGTGADVYFYSDTSGDHLLWDASEEALTVIGTSGQNALNIGDGHVVVSSGNVTLSSGNLAVSAGSVTVAGGDVTVSASASGGDAGARNQYIGLPALKMVSLGAMTNGATESANYLDDNPTGEWTEVDAGTNLVVTADASIYRVGTTSLRINFTDVVTGDGVTGTAGAQDDLSGNESIGFWIYSSVTITAGDFELVVDDSDGTDQAYDIGAVAAGVWTWKEIDISGCNANCDTMDNILILATAQGGNSLTAANVYLDGMWKWDSADEETLGVNLVQDGVLSVQVVGTANTEVHTMVDLVEMTNFIVNYQSGNDVIVTVTDQSANSGIALVAYQ